ncbi:hypothetical protein [Streptomyces sp. NPDC046942]|uniref:hypothetical protein n=1 Tax=Streptomyces sp. NPDC046942 TaxID=3155137 RepID=UPI0033E03291
MFRRTYDALACLLGRARPTTPTVNYPDHASEMRTPDPYVGPLPNPRDARWHRWAKRNRAAGHWLPFPRDEECWHTPTHPDTPLWETTDDVVRPYVQQTLPTEIKIPVPVDFP